MPRLGEELRARRRRHVLQSAWRCFSDDGFHATSMDQVIAASGMSASAVYRYFRGKDELIDATVDEALAAVESVFADLLDVEPLPGPDRALELLVSAVRRRREDEFDLSRLAMQAWTEALRQEHLRARVAQFYATVTRDFEELARRWRDAGLLPPEADPRAVARVFRTLMPGLVVMDQLVEPPSAAELLAGLGVLGGQAGTVGPGRSAS